MPQLAGLPLDDDRPVPPRTATPPAAASPHAAAEHDGERDWLCPLEQGDRPSFGDEELASYCVSCSLAMYCGR